MTKEQKFYEVTGFFPISFVDKDDIQMTFPSIENISDKQLEEIAEKMNYFFLDGGCFWIALDMATREVMNIKD